MIEAVQFAQVLTDYLKRINKLEEMIEKAFIEGRSGETFWLQSKIRAKLLKLKDEAIHIPWRHGTIPSPDVEEPVVENKPDKTAGRRLEKRTDGTK